MHEENETARKLNKCYNCKRRYPGCHSTCESYKQYRKYMNKLTAEMRKQKLYRGYKMKDLKK